MGCLPSDGRFRLLDRRVSPSVDRRFDPGPRGRRWLGEPVFVIITLEKVGRSPTPKRPAICFHVVCGATAVRYAPINLKHAARQLGGLKIRKAAGGAAGRNPLGGSGGIAQAGRAIRCAGPQCFRDETRPLGHPQPDGARRSMLRRTSDCRIRPGRAIAQVTSRCACARVGAKRESDGRFSRIGFRRPAHSPSRSSPRP
jgi:hypothetical protein